MKPVAGEKYRHFKGKEYQIICIANDCEDDSELVIYKALYGEGKIYARSLEDFCSKTDKNKYPNAEQEMRFEKITDACSAGASCESDSSAEDEIPSRVMDFLDAGSIEDKLEILDRNKAAYTAKEIDICAASLDLEIKEGEPEDMAKELIKCLTLRSHFESNRLR